MFGEVRFRVVAGALVDAPVPRRKKGGDGSESDDSQNPPRQPGAPGKAERQPGAPGKAARQPGAPGERQPGAPGKAPGKARPKLNFKKKAAAPDDVSYGRGQRRRV